MANIRAEVISSYMEFTLANWNLKIHLSPPTVMVAPNNIITNVCSDIKSRFVEIKIWQENA